ncbi:type IV pilus modification protein PilV [Shewanella surugensis]|uniref:Type IV pilus modification protein PilV n=1 Tax=Shewanella surugensis TaxID=212020 RepID=A0ABT0L5T9_9GAMM|nr:type IV pilus modification protein PilV [Shewanella surugensis]MCL1123052.1 type IV pilus modification protein PilV [Shewanella surugensis]
MKKWQQGFTLIEVLVALVILVVGLIGIFNLHLIAKRSSFESFQQTQAALLASDMINRMKLNPTQIAAYNGTYNSAPTSSEPACDLANSASPMCTPAQTLAWDRYQWQLLMSGGYELQGENSVGGLDSAVGCIQANGNGDVLIVMTWRGINSMSDGAAKYDDFVQACGTSSVRRRVYVINTLII